MNNRIVPTLTMKLQDQTATSVTVQADKTSVLLTYWDAKGEVVTVRDFSVKDNPELATIVSFDAYDNIWDIDMVLDLLDVVDDNELACDATPVWKWNGAWQPTTKPDFRNHNQQADVA